MQPKPSTTPSREVNKIIHAICSSCKKETNHRILSGLDRMIDDECVQILEKYNIIECCGCNTISFMRFYHSSEDDFTDWETGETERSEIIDIYPHRIEGRAELPDSDILPKNVRQIYKETLTALIGNLKVLTAIGIRALVEAICKEKSAQGKNLENKIDWLINSKILTPDGAEILHSIRTLGNESAHEVKVHTEVELSLAFDVIEHLLLGVYVLPEKAFLLKCKKNY